MAKYKSYSEKNFSYRYIIKDVNKELYYIFKHMKKGILIYATGTPV